MTTSLHNQRLDHALGKFTRPSAPVHQLGVELEHLTTQARALREMWSKLLEEIEDSREAETEHQSVKDQNLMAALDIILRRAEAELSMLNGDWDAADNRVYAFLALDVAGGAALVATRDGLQPWWWSPLIGLGLSAVFFSLALWPRKFDTGPNLRQFYERWATNPPVTVKLQMYGELSNAIATNRERLRQKSLPFYAGAIVLLLTIVVGGLFVGITTASH